MKNLSEFVPFVKVQAQRARDIAKKNGRDPSRKNRSLEAAEQFERLAKALEEHQCSPSPQPGVEGRRRSSLALTPADIADLPQEVLAQLSISESERQEFDILEMFDEAGGLLSLDLALINLYRRTGEVWERSKLNAKLYRMVQKGLLHSVPNRKGIYATRPALLEEGQDDGEPEQEVTIFS